MRIVTLLGTLLFASLPATSNYQLNSYGFGSGGTANSSTATYSLEGQAGDLNGADSSTSNASVKPGFIHTEQANVPQITVDNNSGQYYNKLHFVIQPNSHDPTDATYLIAIKTTSTTNMNTASGLQYVQPDGTLSSTLSLADYQNYSTWGGSGGSLIIGLQPSTTYYVAVRSTQGKFTESAYGPVVSLATAAPTLSFSLVTSSQSSPPFSVDLGTLTAGTIATAGNNITTTLSTNGASGGDIYVDGSNGGLKSSSTGDLIPAVSNDLATISNGFGAQLKSGSLGQAAGGPFTVVGPFNVSGNNVGSIGSTVESLFTSSTPITSGTGSLVLKAKAKSTDIAAHDYQEVLTFVASANF
ncbi:MAG TPA: hypothetical protein VG604_01240 [Candidatus Saccharimonadales bacterium]|nr:hypothetical protein [Candidatus Saccharimonadales bacterium]